MAKRGTKAAGETLAGRKVPQLRKRRRYEWTPAKRRIFLEELARTCNVRAAARKAGMCPASAYRLRKRSAEFRAEWGVALCQSYRQLELLLLERAMNGTVKTVRRGDAIVETVEYPNGMALSLLKMHRANVQEIETEHAPEEMEEVRKRLGRKLEALRRRVEAEEAEADKKGAEAGDEAEEA